MSKDCDAFEQTMGAVAQDFGLEFKRCSSYHFHLKGVFLLNVYPTRKTVYVQGSNGKTTYKTIDDLVNLAKGESVIKGVERGKRIPARGKRKTLWGRGHRKCFVCGVEFKNLEEATLEHKVPLSMGGSNRLDNLTLSHERCNQDRGPRLSINVKGTK